MGVSVNSDEAAAGLAKGLPPSVPVFFVVRIKTMELKA